ncbi:MAG: ABC transporter permease [Caulobacterales bacterium RIFCSPHIGHO2_01_FULL_70_19]|nr:MAG: ABC transporter permease [Caulobacterales bacterium RIFCSPHIGHO2_01_FULL_70_19]
MKKPLALLAAPILGVLAALAAPMSAQAHRAWLAPTSTVLSGDSAWVGFDAGMSNGVFIPDHAPMNLAGLTITAPDGSTVQPENLHRARYRSTFDLHLTQPGTYKVANVMSGVMATYTENGEQKRWRGQAAEFPGALPAGATDVVATRTSSRIETFVTLGAPTDTVFTNPADGLVMIPVTHPNDLVAGEPATFRLSSDGVAAAGVEVTIARGGTRYRDNPEEMTVATGPDGAFTVTWPEPGMYWLNASVRTPAQGDAIAANAQYVAVVEVLP